MAQEKRPAWIEVYGPRGIPRAGEAGFRPAPRPFLEGMDPAETAATMLRLWRDADVGPHIAHWVKWAGDAPGDVENFDDEDDRAESLTIFQDAVAEVDPRLDLWQGAALFGALVRVLFDGDLPDILAIAIVSDALSPESRVRPRLVNLRKDVAVAFVNQHHSEFGQANTKGLLYAFGVAVGPALVAVALGTTPSAAFQRHCSVHGILELSRIASDGTTKGASSMLASRMIDLVKTSGRYGVKGCLLVTYSLLTESGTTYLSLAGKGLRPVTLTKPKATQTGARKGATASKPSLVKVRWEAGDDALPPDWDILAKTAAPPNQVEGAKKQFEQWASANLPKFFHGTPSVLAKGDVLRPPKGAKHVYVTESKASAFSWGSAKAHREGHIEPDPTDPTGFATRTTVPVHVYEVRAPGAMRAREGWTAPSAVVVREVPRAEIDQARRSTVRQENPAKTVAAIRRPKHVEIEHTLDRFLLAHGGGNFEVFEVRIEGKDGEGIAGTKHVALVRAIHEEGRPYFRMNRAGAIDGGWGPLAYDLLMERITELGFRLRPDPEAVTKDAQRVWTYYALHRPDVEKHVRPGYKPRFVGDEYDYTKAPTTLAALRKKKIVEETVRDVRR